MEGLGFRINEIRMQKGIIMVLVVESILQAEWDAHDGLDAL